MKLSEMQVKVMCCDVRMRSVFFFPWRATATSRNMIDANINILTFTATLCGSTKDTHGEEREEEKRAISQSAFTSHAHRANELKRFTDLSSRRKWSENRRRTTVK